MKYFFKIIYCYFELMTFCLSAVLKLNEICKDDLRTNIYLPFGSGSTDSLIVILSNSTFSCILSTTIPNYEDFGKLIGVVLTIESIGNKDFCENSRNNNELALQNLTSICNLIVKKSKEKSVYHFFAPYNISVLIQNLTVTSTLRITFTTARFLKNSHQHCNEAEIDCRINNHVLCISESLRCDGVENCENDEEFCELKEYRYLWLIIGYSFLVIFVLLLIFCCVLQKLFQTRENIQFNPEYEDNRLNLITYSHSAPPTSLSDEQLKDINLIISLSKVSLSTKPHSTAIIKK